MPPLAWRIYYGDGTTYDQAPELAPGYNVQGIVQRHPEVGRQLIVQVDHFWYADGGWLGGDLAGLLDYQMHHTGWQKVIHGRLIHSPAYHALVKRMLADPDFPPKSAKIPGERF